MDLEKTFDRVVRAKLWEILPHEVQEVHRMAGTSEDVTVRMKKNVLSWFGSDERMAKKIYDGKVLTFPEES